MTVGVMEGIRRGECTTARARTALACNLVITVVCVVMRFVRGLNQRALRRHLRHFQDLFSRVGLDLRDNLLILYVNHVDEAVFGHFSTILWQILDLVCKKIAL